MSRRAGRRAQRGNVSGGRISWRHLERCAHSPSCPGPGRAPGRRRGDFSGGSRRVPGRMPAAGETWGRGPSKGRAGSRPGTRLWEQGARDSAAHRRARRGRCAVQGNHRLLPLCGGTSMSSASLSFHMHTSPCPTRGGIPWVTALGALLSPRRSHLGPGAPGSSSGGQTASHGDRRGKRDVDGHAAPAESPRPGTPRSGWKGATTVLSRRRHVGARVGRQNSSCALVAAGGWHGRTGRGRTEGRRPSGAGDSPGSTWRWPGARLTAWESTLKQSLGPRGARPGCPHVQLVWSGPH